MPKLTPDVLRIDEQAETDRIGKFIRDVLSTRLRRRGVVLGISGGVDSAVCAALCVQALGTARVFGLLMPEADSSDESESLGEQVAKQLGIRYLTENISGALEAIGCYRWRDEAIRQVLPDYDGSWPHKLVIRGGSSGKINHFHLVAQNPDGELVEARLSLEAYLQIVAATNFKQRVRKNVEYFHADRLNYAVIGTPNRLEYDQGFFVKNGDGAADIKPIAHLYKSQVYMLAAHLDVPAAIQKAAPTTDTYSLEQGQDEFYFALPYDQMDLALWAHNHAVSAEDFADALDMSVGQADAVYQDITAKRRTTAYQHAPAMLVERITEVLPTRNSASRKN